jgi:hypothetical protein
VEFALPASGGAAELSSARQPRPTVEDAPASRPARQPAARSTASTGGQRLELPSEAQRAASGLPTANHPIGGAGGLAATQTRLEAPEYGTKSDTANADQAPPAIASAVDAYGAQAFALISANIAASLEYTQQLFNVKDPGEFVALSTRHARLQIELMVDQAAALRSVANRLAPPGAQAIAAGLAKAWSRGEE